MNDFFININENSNYPSSSDYFNPDKLFPEYQWSRSDLSKERNIIYEMVRECLSGLNMDPLNYNEPGWNPLGELIHEGDTVVIKPNWVMDYNKNRKVKENSLECLITHPSVVRAVTDYCLIALKGTGKIIIGDAPMQGCNLDHMLDYSGYRQLFEFYRAHSVNVVPSDFRQYSAIVNKNKVITGRQYNDTQTLEVDLGNISKLAPLDLSNKEYAVSDYEKNITNEFHHGGRHRYLVNKDVLSADVVINLCKPKCHRLAGMTGAVKNFVGIIYDKACLPHRTIGSKNEGGDEYIYNSLLKKTIGKILKWKIYFEEKKMLTMSLIMRYTYGVLYYLMKAFSKDKYLIGSWYGNDTIWRTVLDLYYILLYADKNGKLSDKRQRTIFNLADMIISGERNGPVAPEPKKLGIMLAGLDSVVMDRLICEIMGFDYLKVPGVSNSIADKNLVLKNEDGYHVYSNAQEYDDKIIRNLKFPERWRFKPYDTWKGNIEK